MNTNAPTHDDLHRLSESATHPLELRCGALGALLLLVGTSPQRRRALPARPIAARSGAFNCRFQGDRFRVAGVALAARITPIRVSTG